MLIFLKVTQHVQPLTQKPVYQVFQRMIYLVEVHGQAKFNWQKFFHTKVLSKEQFFQEGVLEQSGS